MDSNSQNANDLRKTKDLILNAAEEQFALHGFDGTSVRMITDRAQANVAAINYHFGGKEQLFFEVVRRRMEPFHQNRLQMLDELEKKANGKPIEIEALLDAFITPMLDIGLNENGKGTHFLKLMGRSLMENTLNPRKISSEEKNTLMTLMKRYDLAFAKSLGGKLPRTEVIWRVRFTMDLVHQAMMAQDIQIPMPPDVQEEKFDTKTFKRRLISYAAAGFRAVV